MASVQESWVWRHKTVIKHGVWRQGDQGQDLSYRRHREGGRREKGKKKVQELVAFVLIGLKQKPRETSPLK